MTTHTGQDINSARNAVSLVLPRLYYDGKVCKEGVKQGRVLLKW